MNFQTLSAMLMVTLTITAMILSQKILLGSINAALIPLFLILLLGIFLGLKINKKALILRFLFLMFVLLGTFGIFHFAIALPATPTWPFQTAYAQILKISPNTLGFLIVGLLIIFLIILFFSLFFSKTKILSPPRYRHLTWISMVFVGILLVSNITTQKVIQWKIISVDVGTLYFPITYLFNNIFTEVYGYGVSRRLIWSGLFCNLAMVFLLQISTWLPGDSAWHLQTAYQIIAGNIPRIVFASICGFLCGEFLNSFILAKLKILTQGRWLWTRTVSSTVIGNLVDSLIFNLIAFTGVLPFSIIVNITQWQYAIKVGIEILATPITYAVVNYLKKSDHEDYFDIKTKFNPFRF